MEIRLDAFMRLRARYVCTSEPQTPKRNPFKILERQAKTTKLRNFGRMRYDYSD